METPDTLNDRMAFDHVIQVLPNRVVVDRADIYAPSLYDGVLDGSGWSLLDGWSGQDGYAGPIMHPSEYIGGGMARWILDNPGVYVALVNWDNDSDDADGWAVAARD
jgi:hypothetical protein